MLVERAEHVDPAVRPGREVIVEGARREQRPEADQRLWDREREEQEADRAAVARDVVAVADPWIIEVLV
jgi:hypothetical protein